MRLTHWNGTKYVLPQGMWREITDRLAAFEDIGLEPEEIKELLADQALDMICDDDSKPDGEQSIFTASILIREDGGHVPYVSPVDCCARLYPDDISHYTDNPDVIQERGAHHLVIAVYKDHWHIVTVSGYTPETGLYTKLY